MGWPSLAPITTINHGHHPDLTAFANIRAIGASAQHLLAYSPHLLCQLSNGCCYVMIAMQPCMPVPLFITTSNKSIHEQFTQPSHQEYG